MINKQNTKRLLVGQSYSNSISLIESFILEDTVYKNVMR